MVPGTLKRDILFQHNDLLLPAGPGAV